MKKLVFNIDENITDEFIKLDDHVVLSQEGEILDLYESAKRYLSPFSTLGKYRAIVKDGALIMLIAPLFGSGSYQIFEIERLKFLHSIYEKIKT